MVGRVAALGDGPTAGFAVGDRVGIAWLRHTCGRCRYCLRGAENLCRNAGLMGREVEGSLNQYLRIEARYVFPLPNALPLAEAVFPPEYDRLMEWVDSGRTLKVRANADTPGDAAKVANAAVLKQKVLVAGARRQLVDDCRRITHTTH